MSFLLHIPETSCLLSSSLNNFLVKSCVVKWNVKYKNTLLLLGTHKCFHTFIVNERCESLPVATTLISKCLFISYSNCTGKSQGWPCCVPNYLRTFPKIATETSLLVCDYTHRVFFSFLLARAFKYVPTLTSCSFNLSLSLSRPPVFLSLPADDATRVILKSTDDYINANYINVSLFLLLLLFVFFISIFVFCSSEA